MKVFMFSPPRSGWNTYLVAAHSEDEARVVVMGKVLKDATELFTTRHDSPSTEWVQDFAKKEFEALTVEAFEPGVVFTHFNEE